MEMLWERGDLGVGWIAVERRGQRQSVGPVTFGGAWGRTVCCVLVWSAADADGLMSETSKGMPQQRKVGPDGADGGGAVQ